MLVKLYHFGCKYFGMSVGAIFFADDIALVAASITEMQTMLDICCKELSLLDLKINSKKSTAIRIESRFKAKCVDLFAMNEIIPWSCESRYLGIYIQSGPKFKCTFEKTKAKYYRAVNAILARVGNLNNKTVTLNLLYSVALPVLMYSLEALCLNKTEIISLNHPWIRSFEKLFNTFDKNVVKQCQMYNGCLNIGGYYALNSISFLNKLGSSPNLLV